LRPASRGHYLTCTRSEADAGYDRSRRGPDIVCRRARRSGISESPKEAFGRRRCRRLRNAAPASASQGDEQAQSTPYLPLAIALLTGRCTPKPPFFELVKQKKFDVNDHAGRMSMIDSKGTSAKGRQLPCYSLFSRRMPSIIGCQPNTSETMKASMRRSPGPLSLMVDL
jgi:hypothetical protein